MLPIRSVYFKIKGKGEITLKADFLELVQENPTSFRLPGSETRTGKYYYGYKNLRELKRTVDLIDLKYFKSQNNLRKDVPGSCIIIDPNVE